MTVHRTRAAGAALLIAALGCGSTLGAQDPPRTSGFQAFEANVLIGGSTAAAVALLHGRNPARAFFVGAIGGALHYGGKYVASRRGTLAGWGGLALASTGTSIVTNAGEGAPVLGEVFIPAGSLRLRVTLAQPRARLSVNAYESAVLLRNVTRDGMRVDWGRSAATGTLVFNTVNREIVDDGQTVEGITVAPAIVLGPRAQQNTETWKHETVHLHQVWFLQEAVGRPLESALRGRVPGARFIPSWLDIGFVSPVLQTLAHQWWGKYDGVPGYMESEAELLERR